MLARVQVEHEVHQRALQLRAQVPVDGEARAGQLHGALQVENAEFGPQIPMRLRSEIKFRRRAPAADFDVVFGALSDGHAGVGKVGNAGENFAQARVQIRWRFSPVLNLLAQFFGFGHGRARVLPALLQLGDLFGRLVALRLAGLRLGNRLAPLRVDFAEILQHRSRIHAALAQLFFHQRQVVANKIQIKHGN